MSFASQITRVPRAFDPDRGADARVAVPWADGIVADLLCGTGACSPYLLGLMQKEGAWLEGALDAPETAIADLHGALPLLGPDGVADGLRAAKRRIALLIAVCDLGGAWPLETVTRTLSDFADAACEAALRCALGQEIRRKKLPGITDPDATDASGIVALAMGKMGAGELNYSSDIDLICLFDETRYDRDDFHDARASLVRATRRMAATLGDMTAEGYVFRTDLRLRPDPAVTPVCMAMEAAERYYESLGRTWERAAYIKARPSAGDLEAGARFLDTLRPFVWRKHLDFAAIQDAHDMRLRIREHKGLGGAITLPGHDMKLGRGGIREIEFFTQTRQLIAGGRDPELRVRGTVEGLSRLAAKGWVPEDVATRLQDHYVAHRTVEHRLQMVRDAQTHLLPTGDDGFARLAAFMDRDEAELRADLVRRLEEVHALTEGFFAPDADAAGDAAPDGAAPDAPPKTAEIAARWPRYAALRSSRGLEIFKRLKPAILAGLARAGRPDEALVAFDGFLEGLPAGVQLFSLFEANPQLIDLLVDIVSTAPALAQYLSRNSAVFDAVIGGDFFSDWPGTQALTGHLANRLAAEDDYERKLDAARRWGKEWHFRIGVHLLRGLTDADEAGAQYADLAQAMLAGLWPEVVTEFARKHGPPPGRGAVVLGMGSLGAGRLNARSDLDLIVIYDPAGVDSSDGRRPLAARAYYARLTQALVTGMTAPMAEGRLYEVDMRLRPSGNQGPVATSLNAFRDYQKEQAWLWEHLALTRARVVAGPDDLGADVTAELSQVLARPRQPDEVLREVAVMRARIASAKGPPGAWEPKIGPGRMQDIELLSQAGALMAGLPGASVEAGLHAGRTDGWLDAGVAEILLAAYSFCRAVQTGAKLVSDNGLDEDALGAGGAAFLARLTGCEDAATVRDRLARMTAQAGQEIDALLPAAEHDSGDAT